MKRVSCYCVLLLLSFVLPVHADIYQWVDAAGVTNFTDNPEKIPERYRKQVKKLILPEEPARVPAPPAKGQAGAARAAAPEPSIGGQTETWWRESFAALRAELGRQQAVLAERQARIAELRRKRAIFSRAEDREAQNSVQAELSVAEVRIAELQNQIAALDTQATRAGVPLEWRR
jgi:hypothetical protein